MKPGKIPESILTRSVLKRIGKPTKEVISGALIGEDASVLKSEGRISCTIDPVIGDLDSVGFRAICVAVNNLAATGSIPRAAMVSILLPLEIKEKQLKALMNQIQESCQDQGIPLIGGHTENTSFVTKPVIHVSAIGDVKDEALLTKGAKKGQDIVMTKYAAMEGTALLARGKKKELEQRYSKDFVKTAADLLEGLSILKEANLAAKFGVSALHDARCGGIYGGLWELSSASGVGMKVYLDKIPLKQETVEICEFYDLNPYRLLSGGSLLIVTEKGYDLVQCLEEQGIKATVIGKTTDDNDKIVVREGEEGCLEAPKSDEIHKMFL